MDFSPSTPTDQAFSGQARHFLGSAVDAARRLAAIAVLTLVGTILPAQAATIDTIAREAILIDTSTGTVLFEKNADERTPTSSMSKVMTMYMVFDRIRSGRLSLDDTLPVSENAWRMQGSKMWVELGNSIRVEDLIRGVIIQSGNDACIVLAEGLSGSEPAFAADMTRKAHEMGMTASNFMNASGWPDPDHYSTARDLATLAQRLIKDFPEFLHYYSEKEFTYHGIKQGNRNPLLYRNMGVDGLKTGHTESAGYGLIATGERDGRRLVLVVNGLPNMQARADESARLLEWGWREFTSVALFKAGEMIDTLPVWLGAAETVPAVLDQELKITLTRAQQRNLKVTLLSDGPVAAPVPKGTRIGTLRIEAPDFTTQEIPVLAGADVERMGFFGRLLAAARQVVGGGS
ncbi:D-alanyl-D-alanine carboxypeptidase family protein [Rhodospirillum centenum]|uniref:serine-type D-Ala-D-Ala carboxypeptidase n=1 Tax=Rhodospirillum centenum (strain ATCC 51521 / SW) TaxID=414684 RepID=B6IMK2_RHOCS|nr:D-alanyl-D-alanine carboxypeptidase family protein [Rhodospirillum centenum]ACI98581.1 D-alanyl-D-alanine carboxypeptidase [Rhodospirillum centenum SW]